jgi:hypothetical protein
MANPRMGKSRDANGSSGTGDGSCCGKKTLKCLVINMENHDFFYGEH